MFILAECNIPPVITGILSQLYKIIIVLIPIGIVIFGSIDFIKATMAKDSNAIASSTKTFISRLITGCITFFVLTIVTWLFKTIIGNVGEASSAMSCALQIIGGTAGSSSGYGSQNSYSVQMAANMACYGTQYGLCISQNQNPNKVEECNTAANSICHTNNKVQKPTTTTTTTTTIKTYDQYQSCIEQYCSDLSGVARKNCESKYCSEEKPQIDSYTCSPELNGEEYCNCFESKCSGLSGIALSNCKSKCQNQNTTTTTKSNLQACYDKCKTDNKCNSQRTCNKTGYEECKAECNEQS